MRFIQISTWRAMLNRNLIAGYADGRNNNYNLIRFLAASLVIFSHSYHLTDNFKAEPLIRLWDFIDFAGIAVAVFFVASGFLITQSFDRRRNVFVFLEARMLRIFPTLILAVLLTVFVVGAWATTLPLGEYFRNVETLDYISNNIFLNTQFTLPGVFAGNLFPNGVNGALWTLSLEFYMYLLVAVLGVLGALKSRHIFNLVLAVAFFIFLWHRPALFFLPDHWGSQHLKLVASFALGAFAYVNREYISLNFLLGIGMIALTVLSRNASWFMYVFYVSLAYWTMLIAYHPMLRLNWFNRFGDYSYGLYIFGFPIQQSLVHILGKPAPLFLFFLAFPIVLILAILSWHTIEKPALGLKDKFPWLRKPAAEP